MSASQAVPRGTRIALFAAVLAGCLLFYSGLFHSSDAQFTVALTESLVTRGEFVTSPLWWHQDAIDTVAPDGESYAKAGIGASLVAAPLYMLAFLWPGLGMAQAVTLASALLTALNAVILCRLIERLGVGPRAALAAALLWAFGTSALVYANYYFTEPISALALTATLYSVVAWRMERRARHLWLVGLAVSLAVATKLVNALFVAPFLLLLSAAAWPLSVQARDWPARAWRAVTALWPAAVPVAITLAGIGLYNAARFGSPLNSGYPAYETFDHPLLDGLWGLLLSSRKGVIWYNPLLVASVLAFPLFARRYRAGALAIAAATVLHAGLYAAYFLWDGGLNWGPRYLVPLLPLWILPLAVWLDAGRRRPRGLNAAFALLCAASIAVQIIGVTISFLRFDHAREGLGALAQDWPIAGHALLLARTELWDFAWMRSGAPDGLLLAILLLFAVLSGLALSAAVRGRLSRGALALLMLGTVGIPLFLLARAADDPRFGGGADFDALLRDFAAQARRDDAMLLDNHVRTSYFLNQDRALARWYALDRHADGSPRTLDLLERLRARYGTIWLITDLSPGAAAQRPIEGWLSARAYKAEDRAYSPYARLLRYDVREAGASRDVNARLGDAIELHAAGWQPPSNASAMAYLLIEWRALATPAQDYTVFVQLLGADGRVAWQSDRQPVDGFRPTSAWTAGDSVGDRYAFRWPADLPAGGYRVIAGMYDWRTGARLPVSDAQGRPSEDFVEVAAQR